MRPTKPSLHELTQRPVGEAFRPPAARSRLPPRPTRKRNRLPLETYREPGAYALTLVTHGRVEAFADETVVKYCLEALRATSEARSFQVFAYCFMPDHLHLLVGTEEIADVIAFVSAFKQKTGYWYKNRATGEVRLPRTKYGVPWQPGGPGGLKPSLTEGAGLWQRSFHDHIVRSEESLRALAEYVLDNPVVAGLTEERGQYPWAGSFVWQDLF